MTQNDAQAIIDRLALQPHPEGGWYRETWRADAALGPDIIAGEAPQHLIPPGHWQATAAEEGWALVSCIVSPAFDFAGFELAAEGWARGMA